MSNHVRNSWMAPMFCSFTEIDLQRLKLHIIAFSDMANRLLGVLVMIRAIA